MKKFGNIFRLGFITGFALTGFFTDLLTSFSLVIFFLIFLITILILIIQVVRKMLKSNVSFRPMLYTASLLLGPILNIGICFFRNPDPVPDHLLHPSEQLRISFYKDQGDRSSLRYFRAPERDKPRLDLVHLLHHKNLIKTTDDKYYAAFILHHGTSQADYELAHQFASEIKDSNREGSVWLFQATYDRLQESMGKPQKYGTQYTF